MKVNIHTHHPKNDERTLSVVGIHPYDSEGATTDSVFAVERLCTDYDAIGEIGLDFACNAEREKQLLIFQAQLEVAHKAGKGVVLHCVKAFENVMDCLKDYTLPFVIFHGFIGSTEQAKRATNRGYFLSFGHRAFRSPKSIEAMKNTPTEQLFFETDECDVSIDQIYSQASAILGIPEAMLEYITNENFDKICG
jgi:TatD DNase family protein